MNWVLPENGLGGMRLALGQLREGKSPSIAMQNETVR